MSNIKELTFYFYSAQLFTNQILTGRAHGMVETESRDELIDTIRSRILSQSSADDVIIISLNKI